MKRLIIALSAILAMMTGFAYADGAKLARDGGEVVISDKDKQEYIRNAQEKLKATFIRMNVTDFGESPIPGIYEVVTGNRVIYFHPEKEMLIFGEIYTKNGKSLTQARLQQEQKRRVAKLDLSDALVIGNGPKNIIEFSDPECPYCQKFHAYAKKSEDKITRYIIFTPIRQLHPNAHKKAVHVLCSENKEQALDDVFSNRLNYGQLTTCREGEELLARHEQVSSQFGVSATPTLVLGDSVVTGFNQARIAQFINQ